MVSAKRKQKRTPALPTPILKSPPSLKKGSFSPKVCRASLIGDGDLVMGTASAIDHPDFHNGKVSSSYLFFGIVKGTHHNSVCTKECTNILTHGNVTTADTVHVNWAQVEEGHTPIKSANAKFIRFCSSNGCIRTFKPVSKNSLSLLAKADNPHLDGINAFVKVAVLDNFFFVAPHGWYRVKDKY